MAVSNRRAIARVAVVAVCLVALAGCSTVKGWFGGKSKKDDPTEPAALVAFTPSAQPTRVWSTGVGKGERNLGLRASPAVADGRVYATAVEDGVRALDLQTGAQVWSTPIELRLSAPGVGDGVVVVGSLSGDIVALDASTGAERWRAKVASEVVAAPAVGQGYAIVRSNEGRVTAFDLQTGERRWFWARELPPLTVRGSDSPTFGPGVIFVGNDDGTVAALALNDGRLLWEQTVAAGDGRTELDRMVDVDGSPVIDGTTLFATSYKQQSLAIEGPSGRPLWSSQHGGPGRIGVASDRIVVSDVNGAVWGLDKSNGSALWQQPALARRGLTGLAVQGDYAVVGDVEGYLHWMKLDNGEFAARTRAGRKPYRGAPVVVDGLLVVQNVNGDVSAWRIGQ